ncbi:hypothetical protein [Virgibacillus sp. L01]
MGSVTIGAGPFLAVKKPPWLPNAQPPSIVKIIYQSYFHTKV